MYELKILANAEFVSAVNNLAEAIKIISGGIKLEPENTTAAATITPEAIVPVSTENPTMPAAGVPSTVNAAPLAQPVTAPTPVVAAPVSTVAPTVATTTIPTAAPTYTLEMIAKAGTALIDAGKMSELTALLAKYGVEALTALDPAHYGTFAAELRAMGASI